MTDFDFTATFIMGMACASILWMGVFAWAFMRAPRRKGIPAPRAETYVLFSGDKNAMPVGPEDRRWLVLKQRNRKNRVTRAFGEDV